MDKRKIEKIKKKTWGKTMNELMACKSKDEAQKWFEKEVTEHSIAHSFQKYESFRILKESLGYMMGYYDKKTGKRIQKLLDLCHPVFPWLYQETNK